MDLTKNKIPSNVSHIHLIGVCGSAMGALACSLKSMGYHVTGSDQAVYPPMSTFLKKQGIKIQIGYLPEHIKASADLVVIGNTAKKTNPEVMTTIEQGLFFCSLPQAVNHFMGNGKKLLVVTGTHGKTTASSILAWILESAGYSPSFLIGGILKNFDCNFQVGSGDYLVLEGDEYDTSFFDKGPKFMHYLPHSAILTSVEFDHADIYKDVAAVQKAFRGFVSQIPSEGMLFAADTGAYLEEVLSDSFSLPVRYGQKDTATWRFENIKIQQGQTTFDVFYNDSLFGSFTTSMMGVHNLANTIACIGVLHRIGLSASQIAKGLLTFKGIKRRQEIRGVQNKITVLDDFAHHPTAVTETIRAVKPFFPNGRLIAVFEPRTNSSRRNFFQKDYPYSFIKADLICIPKPPLQENIDPKERFCSKTLVNDLQKLGKEAYFFQDASDIIDFISDKAKPEDVILIMSNGGFDNIHERLLTRLKQKGDR